jgi:erythromycin esterase-like protein
VIDRLSDYQVIIVGETHLIREQQQFTAALIRALHAEGYRQLLLEWPHLADWVLSEYAVDGVRRPEWWEPPINMLGDLITTIRNFNLTLPENERIAV